MRFKRFLFFIFAVVFFTACDSEYKTVYHYRIENCNSYVNLREQATVESNILTTVKLHENITILEYNQLSIKDNWSKIRTRDGHEGYVQNRFIGYWTSKEKVEPQTIEQRLWAAKQPVTGSIFSAIESLGQMKMYYILFFMCLTVALAIAMSILSIDDSSVSWLSYLVMALFLAAELTSLLAIFNHTGKLAFKYAIPNLLLGIGVLALPYMQWVSYKSLLGNIIGEDDCDNYPKTRAELITTAILAIALAVCIVFFPQVADMALYIFLGVKLLMWIIFILIDIRNAGSTLLFCLVSFIAEIPFVLMLIGLAALALFMFMTVLGIMMMIAIAVGFLSRGSN